jgi:hypothetical protein
VFTDRILRVVRHNSHRRGLQMAQQGRGSESRWVGVLREQGAAAWVRHELDKEAVQDSMLAPEGARPVSVRIEPETIAVLDAFADRFRMTRSKMLLQLIRGGLSEAFDALPETEQAKMLDAATAKAAAAGWRVRFGPVPTVTSASTPDDAKGAE